MNSINKFIDKKIEQRYSNVAYGRSLFRDGDYDIVIGSTEDAMVMEFKDETLVKLAIGFVTDITGAYAEPGIVFGSGNAYGDNRGFITKDTNSLNLYYIGDLSEGEVAGLAIYKDKIESTVPITVNAGLAGEFILDAANWAAKLTEADAKTIVENPSKAWSIATENLVNADVASWAAGGTGAAAVSIIEAALNITGDFATELSMGTTGIIATKVGDATTYAQLTAGGLYIEKGAISIKSAGGDLMMSGAGIIANQIIAGTMTGMNIQTAATGKRMIFSTNGIQSYNAAGFKSGLWVDVSEIPYADFSIYQGMNDTLKLFSVYDTGSASVGLNAWDNRFAECFADSFDCANNWDFDNAVFTGKKQPVYVATTAPSGDDLYEDAVWLDIS